MVTGTSPKFVLDQSALSDAYDLYYAPSITRVLWDQLAHGVETGQIMLLDKIVNEVWQRCASDGLRGWAERLRGSAHVAEEDELWYGKPCRHHAIPAESAS